MYLPGYYADPIEEYWALLNDVTVWDVSVERIVEITGPDASAFTNMLTCRDLTKCAVGQGKYVLITAEDGGIVNDPVLLRIEADRWWLALADSRRRPVGARRRDPRRHGRQGPRARGLPVQVQGPKSKDVMRTLFGARHRRHQVLLDADDRARRHPGRHQPDRLDRRGRLRDLPARPVARRRPVGPDHGGRQAARHPPDRAVRGAPDRGRHLQLRLGHDHRDTPFHVMGLERLVETQDADYIGKAALEEIRGTGVDRKLVGIEVAGDALPFELSRKCDALSRRQGGRDRHRPHLVAAAREEHRLRVGADRAGRPRHAARDRRARRRHLAGDDGGDPVPRPEEGRPARLIDRPGDRSVTHASPLTPDEIAAVRKPYRAASLLPGRAYHDPAILDFERDRVVPARLAHRRARGGRRPTPGTYFLAEVDDEPLIVVRGRDERPARRSTTSAATAARPSSRSRAARRSASSARTTPGSTTSTAR